MKNAPHKDLQVLPGVGPSIARDLADLGYARPDDLRGEDPQEMYDRLCTMRGSHIDRCVLYVFRCAVYAAQTDRPEPDLLKWWSWKHPANQAPHR
ncbi:MAG: helix-hairpin-helix domain-containing protein [Gemmatimonadota bacterium]|nr:helix-hairpin-helix domain-containing protein [Gemmatimonadota bacterium]